MIQELTQIAEYQTLLDSYENILLDCDGVLWEGDHLIPNVDKVLKHLRTLGKRICNTTRSRVGLQALSCEKSVIQTAHEECAPASSEL